MYPTVVTHHSGQVQFIPTPGFFLVFGGIGAGTAVVAKLLGASLLGAAAIGIGVAGAAFFVLVSASEHMT